MFGPGDALRFPGDAIGYARRLLEEVIAMRLALEAAVDRLEDDIGDLKLEVSHIRRRVDELADTIPTEDEDKGPIAKVKDALS